MIVVVEDLDEDFATFTEASKRWNTANRIERVLSGKECLYLLTRSLEGIEDWPTLVLLDIDSESDDGRDTLIQIKNDHQLCKIPVVILTTSANPRDRQFCYDDHANAYHIKSINHVTHLQTVKQIFSFRLRSAMVAHEPRCES